MTDKDIWHPLGEQRWRQLAEGTGASELQLKFAAARFGGATATAAARMAGYSGDGDSLRRAGYAAVRSTAVQNLLELAAINAPGDARISDREIDAKIAKLIRSADSNVSLKAMELHAKRETSRQSSEPDVDELISTYPDVYFARLLEAFGPERGPVMVSLWAWYVGSLGKGNEAFVLAPFLEKLAPHVAADFPDVWRWLCNNYPENDHEQKCFAEMANKPRQPVAEIISEVNAKYEQHRKREAISAA